MLSGYFGNELTSSRLWTEMVAQMAPMITKATATTPRTANTDLIPARSIREISGGRRKLVNAAKTMGNRNSLAQAGPASVTTK